MDKQAKKILLCILCLCFVLPLFACGAEAGIEGTWQTIGRSDRMMIFGAQEETWVFAEDGTATQYWDGEFINSGTYTLEEGIVTIKFFSGDSPAFELNGNELLQDGVAVMVRKGEG
ncbi:MAG TPA: hypothetical protein DEB31_00210 [Clostridiales bacterium]|nr:hypothetical protein [Clostridiales bacterium]